MNSRTKRLEPRLRLLISGRFFPTEARSLQSLGWPVHVMPVADQAAPHAEATWLQSLETAALHADAIVCLLVNDTAHYPNPPHAQHPTTVAAPDWPSRLLETVSEWRRQWHTEPLIVRCLSVASLAQAGALAQRLAAPNASACLPVEPLDTRLHLVLQSCNVNGQWHLNSPLPWWQHREPLDGRASIRRGMGLTALTDSLLKPLTTQADRSLYVCGHDGELWQSSQQPLTDLRAELRAWLRRQSTGTSGLGGSSCCVTSDPRPGH